MSDREIVIVGDVHGEFEALSKLVGPEDTLFIAGDVLIFMDFTDFSKGILSKAFTIDELIEGLKEMSEGRLDRVKTAFMEITTPGEERYEKILPLIEEEYERFSRSLVCETYILYGNDDYPDILKEKVSGRAEIIESGVVKAPGINVALVSGMPGGDHVPKFPGIVSAEVYGRRLLELAPADIIITHVPPHEEVERTDGKPDETKLTYDTIAKRNEPSSDAITKYINRHNPVYSFFGHVHNPSVISAEIARTQAVNLGFFRLKKEVTRLNIETMNIRKVGI
ncbi:MAG: metallophosphoesterase [Deltaproteobacteria bacterium]|uniref:Metallophosphoesterase n=1 Tax=Candidatus Zymogenus saltonus TaxID=2844893 RepID=A0A9D8KC16_9DELT|nr:metallophosphoesterase [Candidatus Zymogenus saltonus]